MLAFSFKMMCFEINVLHGRGLKYMPCLSSYIGIVTVFNYKKNILNSGSLESIIWGGDNGTDCIKHSQRGVEE